MLEAMKQRGFTLIEAMVVVAIAAILAALAGPSFKEMIRSQRVRTCAFNVYADLTLARNEAVRRNAAVTVKAVGGDWNKGWTLRDSADTQIKSSDSPGSSVTLSASPAGTTAVTFQPSGRLTAGSSVLTISISSDYVTNTSKRCIRLDPSGMPKSIVGACA